MSSSIIFHYHKQIICCMLAAIVLARFVGSFRLRTRVGNNYWDGYEGNFFMECKKREVCRSYMPLFRFSQGHFLDGGLA